MKDEHMDILLVSFSSNTLFLSTPLSPFDFIFPFKSVDSTKLDTLVNTF